MPQIFVIVSPDTNGRPYVEYKYKLPEFERSVAETTEKIFQIEGENDVTITRVEAIKTWNEASVQVEVRYTAGENKYGRSEVFDPPEKKKEELADAILRLAEVVFPKDTTASGKAVTVSVRIKPNRGSLFRTMVA